MESWTLLYPGFTEDIKILPPHYLFLQQIYSLLQVESVTLHRSTRRYYTDISILLFSVFDFCFEFSFPLSWCLKDTPDNKNPSHLPSQSQTQIPSLHTQHFLLGSHFPVPLPIQHGHGLLQGTTPPQSSLILYIQGKIKLFRQDGLWNQELFWYSTRSAVLLVPTSSEGLTFLAGTLH